MARKSGSKVLKRQAAPAFYSVPRKRYPFITRTGPGPHPRNRSYDPVTLMRDILKVADTREEAIYVLRRRRLLVDGVARVEPNFPIGLMDVIEFSGTSSIYRMLPTKGSPVYPLPIPQEEKGLKLCQIARKVTVKGGKVQLGTHDGRTFVVEDPSKYRVGDSILVTVPQQEIKEVVPMKKGYLALVVGGRRLGSYGEIVEIIDGTFSNPRSLKLKLPEGEVILPMNLVMPVGKEKPLLSLPLRS
ncbi:MAG: 30S ribosomal protein S4e [Conexivisphaerales archaeon]